ncbi:Fe(3+)-hydroxamate ABC transporter substrate-binding protein FhuD [Acerihabitans sp. TG2]|uniref:Fe(3+)-hydroxamate ABC transporter substrate-binding protein FhuD n=1 Tax=Acerihabitans sp. TG2 TaxID=3096008 RepID=UPI002B229366|nr:Fe(3+)-hydroxamate ABC transporter substrate-binding protein FhuD [Acerihabitans sp. TG2]MEA9391835.1 Fe(3+)-hydroxamate ABC transporter substrate-binding protein FhuD [Acerihabitans sp. TG2]
MLMPGDVTHLNRRRLLKALLMLPLLRLPAVQADEPPVARRIIALEWLPVELLFTLGVTPLAVAGTRDYRQWVQEPALPAQVIDVGQRSEPNFELLAELRPDLILYSAGYGPRPEQLSAIAPAMGFSFTDKRGKPLDVVRAGLLSLAQRLGLDQVAQAHLAFFDRQIAQTRLQLASYREQPLLVFSLLDERHALIVGKTSLFGQVMEQLGIVNAWQGDNNFWGTSVIGIERLAMLPPARALCMDHGNGEMLTRLAATPLWRAMPFVRRHQLRVVSAIWIYGATWSALRFCRALRQVEAQW